MTTTASELFDGAKFEVPFPKVDGKNVTDLVLRLGGTLKLNRNDPEHATLIESLTLGKYITLQVSASVEGKGQSFRYDEKEESEVVTHVVSLKLHTAEPVQ